MPLEDYGQYRLIAPSRLEGIEDDLAVLRAHATAELYEDEPDALWINFGASLNSVYEMQCKLRALQSELHAAYEVRVKQEV